jgi:hypothetical protein
MDGNSLKYFHGLFNLSVIALFLYQGRLGLKVRTERLHGKPAPSGIIRRHRKLGPILALMGMAGFLAGIATVFINTGSVFKHPLHFLNGLTIVLLIALTSFISRKIRGRDPAWRNPHFVLGIVILCLYFIQAYIGLNMLL